MTNPVPLGTPGTGAASDPGGVAPRPGKVVLIVCDSLGVGEAPDAADYGDRGADTATANQYSDLSGAVLHGFAHLFGVVGIIVRNRAVVRAEVNQIVASAA